MPARAATTASGRNRSRLREAKRALGLKLMRGLINHFAGYSQFNHGALMRRWLPNRYGSEAVRSAKRLYSGPSPWPARYPPGIDRDGRRGNVTAHRGHRPGECCGVFTTATVAGNTAPDGLSTSWDFEYGTTTGYGLLDGDPKPRGAIDGCRGVGSPRRSHTRDDLPLPTGRERSSAGTARLCSDADKFSTPEAAPVITTYAASRIAATTSAVVSGTVDPNGLVLGELVRRRTAPRAPTVPSTRRHGVRVLARHRFRSRPPSAGSLQTSLITSRSCRPTRRVRDLAAIEASRPPDRHGRSPETPEGVATTSATPTGSVDPDGQPRRPGSFQYGLTTSVRILKHTVPAQRGIGNGRVRGVETSHRPRS